MGQADTVFLEVIEDDVRRQRRPLVPLNERVNAAARPARGDVAEPARGGVAEVHRERGDDEEMIFLRDGAGLGVVFGDGGIFVAEIHLDDFLHVLVQLRELLLELRRLRPDAAVDRTLLVIREVHQRGKVLAESDRIENGKAQFSRRRGGEQPEDDIVDRGDGFTAAGLTGFKKDRAFERISQREGHRKISRSGQRQPFVFGQFYGEVFEFDLQPRKPGGVVKFRRRRPLLPPRKIPLGKNLFGNVVRRADRGIQRFDGLFPIRFERLPLALPPAFLPGQV